MNPDVLKLLVHHTILALLDKICSPVTKKGSNKLVMLGSDEYVMKIRGWQAMCCLSRFVTDDIIETDSTAGFPMLAELSSLQAEGVCSFVLTGYWHLFRLTLDHNSPLHNFAPVEQIGPLDRRAGVELATEPMQRMMMMPWWT